MPRHEVLREGLARLECGRRLRGTHDQATGRGEPVHHAQTQRQFGADDREVDSFADGQVEQRRGISRVHRDAPGLAGDTGVPGRTDDGVTLE